MNERADAGRDCRTRLTRPNSQARTRTGKYSADHVQDWQPYPVDPYSCYMCDRTYNIVLFTWLAIMLYLLFTLVQHDRVLWGRIPLELGCFGVVEIGLKPGDQ